MGGGLFFISKLSTPNSQLGICLDTQHLFASGYNLDTALDQFDKFIGLKYLGVVHLNDSKTEFGSRVDRHENLGQGKIGKDVLQKFVYQLTRTYNLATIPLILEVPGIGEGPRKVDIDKAKSLLA